MVDLLLVYYSNNFLFGSEIWFIHLFMCVYVGGGKNNSNGMGCRKMPSTLSEDTLEEQITIILFFKTPCSYLTCYLILVI